MDLSPIDFAEELNPEQYAAVCADPGPALVLAGAGSGKTRTLTYRVAWLLLEKRVHPGSILLLTFTNKAAKEMTERVRLLTSDASMPAWSGTFHSIGGRILRRHGEHVGLRPNYNILDQDDSEKLLKRIIKETDKEFLKNKDNPKPSMVANLISFGRNTRQSLAQVIEDRAPWFDHILPRLEKFEKLYHATKLEQQVADYDDLLVYWLKLLEEHEETRTFYQHKFKWILVDEYQDTNLLQSRIIDLIGSHHNIMAVGDDAQCIYTWRGANFENIRNFPDRHPGSRIYKITTNYRSTPEILEFANAILYAQPAAAGYEKELVASRPGNLPPFIVPLIDTQQQARFIIKRIEALHHDGIELKEIAVLYRSHFLALDTQLEFSRQGIPFVITSGVRFFEQAHVRDFVAQLRAVSNPSDTSAFDRLFSLLPRVGPATVMKILRAARKRADTAKKEKEKRAGDLFEGDDSGASESFIRALAHESVVGKVPADARDDYESLIATLQELEDLMTTAPDEDGNSTEHAPAELIEHAIDGWYGDYIRNVYPNWEQRKEDLESLIGFAERFRTLPELLAQLVLLNSETNDKGVEAADDAVRMTTIHQAKGLEYSVVFVIGCADEQFPSKRSIEDGNLEEERRLFYVAATRAKDELYLCYPMINSGRGGALRLDPSRFLMEIPRDRFEKLDVRQSRW